MKKLILIALALTAFVAVSAEKVKKAKRTRAPAVDVESAKKLGVSRAALSEMKRRLQVLNATTNRPVESVITTREAVSGTREKMKKLKLDLEVAEIDAKYTREIRKAAKKTTKGLNKIVKTIEKERAKATDQDEIELLDSLLDILALDGWYST